MRIFFFKKLISINRRIFFGILLFFGIFFFNSTIVHGVTDPGIQGSAEPIIQCLVNACDTGGQNEIDPPVCCYQKINILGGYDEKKSVSCTAKPVCAKNLNNSAIDMEVPTISVEAGMTIADQVAKFVSAGVQFPLECLECDKIPGLDLVSFDASGGSNNYDLKISFNSATYINTKKLLASDLPITIKLPFLAKITLSGEQKFKYMEGGVTITPLDCSKSDGKIDECTNEFCFYADSIKKCLKKGDPNICKGLAETDCGKSDVCTWSTVQKSCVASGIKKGEDATEGKYGEPKGYTGPLPPCAFTGHCRDVNDLIQLFVNYGTIVIGIIAGFAFAFFVYGGFVWIFSFGNSEKVQKGQQILVAAVVGLIIVFSAYVMIDFLLKVLDVKEGFKGI